MDTASYDEFAEGYYLTRKAMEWFWDAYIPDPDQRAEITASPNQATTEQLARAAADAPARRRGRPAARRGRGLRGQAPRGRRRRHHRALRRHRPRLHAAQRDERGQRHARGDRPGHRLPAARPRLMTDTVDELAGKLKRTELQHSRILDPRPRDRAGPDRDPRRRRVGLAPAPRRRGRLHPRRHRRDAHPRPTDPHPAHRRTRFSSRPAHPHNAIDLGPDTGRMLSTYIVETDQPIATFIR